MSLQSFENAAERSPMATKRKLKPQPVTITIRAAKFEAATIRRAVTLARRKGTSVVVKPQ